MAAYKAFPADGFAAAWATGDNDQNAERVTLQWDNEAWTVSTTLGRERAECVIRLSPMWIVRQLLLFRDLPEPDLWLGTDGHGHWGEVNGAHRPELDGAVDVTVVTGGRNASVFTRVLPLRRLPVEVGGSFDARVLAIDVETLAVDAVLRTYRRIESHRWEVMSDGEVVSFDVDDFGLPLANRTT
jgi:uncharacterized protein